MNDQPGSDCDFHRSHGLGWVGLDVLQQGSWDGAQGAIQRETQACNGTGPCIRMMGLDTVADVGRGFCSLE